MINEDGVEAHSVEDGAESTDDLQVSGDLLDAETALRQLVQDVMRRKYGHEWIESVTEEKKRKLWAARAEKDRTSRPAAVVDDGLFDYSQITDLRPLIEDHWGDFASVLGDKQIMLAYLNKLETLRNTAAHGRKLLPFERSLILGISGELRNLATLYKSRIGDQVYPRIESVIDSFGHSVPRDCLEWLCPKASHLHTGSQVILRPGDEVAFDCRGWDPEGLELSWIVGTCPGIVATDFEDPPTYLRPKIPTLRQVDEGKGSTCSLKWRVEAADIREEQRIGLFLVGDGDYHRFGAFDACATFSYQVAPPRGRRAPTKAV